MTWRGVLFFVGLTLGVAAPVDVWGATLNDSGEPGSVIVFHKFVTGSVDTPDRGPVPATEFEISVSHCTTPLNFDMPALTVTMPAETSTVDAFTVSFAEVVTVTPAVSVTPALLLTVKLPTPLAAVGRAVPLICAAVPLYI